MDTIEGYLLLEKLDETGRSLVYRARAAGDGPTVIVKLLKSDHTSHTDMARFRQEYAIIREIDSEGVVRTHDIVIRNDSIAIIFEDFDGITLKNIIRNESIDLGFFLDTATTIAGTLGQIHQKKIIHGDIKPANILLNREKGIVKISDFGIARVLTREDQDLHQRTVIEGTLAYLSPEQTGRINRTVDYRTDLYSFGVTLYEMLTGVTPFMSADPMEIIHAHIARVPVEPNRINPSIPSVISKIVMKLLGKSAEDRYQNSFVLQADFKECRKRLTPNGGIEEFDIAAGDMALTLYAPQKLVGRDTEIARITQTFTNAREGGHGLLLVSGPPGIGKSALLNEIQKFALGAHGYFITGKYDQFSRDAPYRGFQQAFSGLAAEIMMESSEQIEAWKEKINRGMGQIGRVITDVMPGIDLITGPQPEVQELAPLEARNRFIYAFKKFLMALTGDGTPIVLFLDDLQWADAASLSLARTIVVDSEIQHLIVIGAYRDTEVGPAHPLSIVISEIAKSTPVENMHLAPLELEQVNEFLAIELKSDPKRTHELAGVVRTKTGGNPFFLLHFIRSLHEQGLLVLAAAEGDRPSWQWDIDTIKKLQVTENIVDLMSGTIAQLPANTRQLLEIASCIGSRFDLEVLAKASGKSVEETLSDLTPALAISLAVFAGDSYRFYHDKIMEAAYSRIEENTRNRLHDKIGGIMLDAGDENRQHENIIVIVDHLNHGRHIQQSEDQKINLARLNLMAGQRAQESVAYAASLNYLKTGIELLESAGGKNGCWDELYCYAFDLHRAAAEVSYLLGYYDEMDRYCETAMEHTRTILDEARIFEIRIQSHKARRELLKAVYVGVEILNKCGINLPLKPSLPRILLAVIRIRLMSRKMASTVLLNRPEVTDPRILAISRIVVSVSSASFYALSKMVPLMVELSARQYIRHGYTPESPDGLAGCALIVCGIWKDIDRGYLLGRLAMRLLERHKNLKARSRLYYLYYFFIHQWKEDIRDVLEPLLEGYQYGLESGEHEFSGFCAYGHCVNSWISGTNLQELEQKISVFEESLARMGQEVPLHWLKIVHQGVQNFIGGAQDPSVLAGSIYNKNETLPAILESGDMASMVSIHLIQMLLCYGFNDNKRLLENAKICKKHFTPVTGMVLKVAYHFQTAHARFALYRTMPPFKRIIARMQIWHSMRQLKKMSLHAPLNNQHRYDFILAELHRIKGKDRAAMSMYEKAIEGAQKNEFLHEVAMMCERAADFYREMGLKEITTAYLTKAYIIYAKWGAYAKVKQMEELYPESILKTTGGYTSGDDTSGSSSSSAAASLDLSTVLKAARALSSEIDLGKLLEKMLRLAMENAGARSGSLILENDGKLCIEAQGTIDGEIEVMCSIDLTPKHEKNQPHSVSGAIPFSTDAQETDDVGLNYPLSIIQYVARTGENLVIDNAEGDRRFGTDPYVSYRKTKSILCVPIRDRGKRTGIIYLENSLAAGAFTPDRVEILRVLSVQAAISIENARLIEVEREKAVLDREIEMAEKIQRSLLPLQMPEVTGACTAYRYEPMMGIGGDFVALRTPAGAPHILGLFICDVSGHGVPAAMTASMVSAALDFFWEKYILDPGTMFSEMQKFLKQKMGGNFFTACACTLDTADGTLTMASAGHPHAIIVKKDGSASMADVQGRMINEYFPPDTANRTMRLDPGDRVILYTDGITEAENPSGRMLGADDIQFLAWMSEISGRSDTIDDLCEKIYHGVIQYAQKVSMDDDITVLACEYTGGTVS